MQDITRKFFNEKCKEIKLPFKEEYMGEYMGEYISFYRYTTHLNEKEFRNFYIIDLTDEDVAKSIQEKLDKMKNYFYECYFYSIWYDSGNLKWDNNVIFMTDENLKYHDPEIESNYEYIRKRFVSESDVLKILARQETLKHDDSQIPFIYEGEKHNLARFNILFGNNGTGKTRMLNEMSNQFNVPILNEDVDKYTIYDTEGIKRTLLQVDHNNLIDSYKRLWNYSTSKTIDLQNLLKYSFSSTELKFLMYAAKLSTFEHHNPGIILLDDIGWNGFDSQRTLNAIEYLSDLSLTGNSVVCATTSPNVKTLMYRKTYKPNVIDLN